MKSEFGDAEKLELLKWFITHNDAKRSSITSRATIIVGVGAAFLTATYFTADKAIGRATPGGFVVALTLCAALVTMVLVMIALCFAFVAIVNVWRPSRQILMSHTGPLPERLFFRPRDTTTKFQSYAEYEKAFREATRETFLKAAMAEAFSQTHEYHLRYQRLRKAMQFLIVALGPITVALLCTGLSVLGR